MKYTVKSKKSHLIKIDRRMDFNESSQIEVDKNSHNFQIVEKNTDGSLRTLSINNRQVPVQVDKRVDGLPEAVWINGTRYPVEIEKVESTRMRPPQKEKNVSGEVKANLPGVVVSLMVNEGDSVKKGQPLLILEAMKMENELLAPKDGVIKSIVAKSGQTVMKNDLILVVE